eukprot:1160526-Pelagomonas_calceolata.AAC.11
MGERSNVLQQRGVGRSVRWQPFSSAQLLPANPTHVLTSMDSEKMSAKVTNTGKGGPEATMTRLPEQMAIPKKSQMKNRA